MEIRGTSPVQTTQAVSATSDVNSVESTQQVNHPDIVDQLDISAEAQAASQIGEATDARALRIAEIKSQIAEGSYETAEKLDAAVDRLLDEMA